MWLQSKERLNDGCVLYPDESLGSVMPKLELDFVGAPCGSFGRINGNIAYFYRWNGVLTFRFGTQCTVRLDDAVTEWRATGGRGYFAVKRNQELLFEKSFAISTDVLNIESDPTAFAEAEDFDFLLFVHKVQSSSERRDSIYR